MKSAVPTTRVVIEETWTKFAARHGLTLFRHGHGLLLGVKGHAAENVELAISERLDGLECAAWPALPSTEEFVLCDASYVAWCQRPAVRRVADEGERLSRRRDVAEWPPLVRAYCLPHLYTPIPALTGEPAFDARFSWLVAVGTLHLDPPLRHALMALPEPVFVSALVRVVRVRLPFAVLDDDVLTRFRAVLAALPAPA
ncbi:hypothetical protein [Nannocystis sp. SCPEA4]|uniref:hypothetical protein n=1 Tax=Nannocystis sp. SCPEA4 TaxID=2996787 RepID=UPI00226F7B7B|nr:hypothetical protein [Nannocystis sp. SCPEA4]MCY1056828.1 hypothetical protein [Nannocystis sp. SCPEA4]